MGCKNCPEYYGTGQGISSCSYSCKKKIEAFLKTDSRDKTNINTFCKTLYEKSGVFVRPNLIYTNIIYLQIKEYTP